MIPLIDVHIGPPTESQCSVKLPLIGPCMHPAAVRVKLDSPIPALRSLTLDAIVDMHLCSPHLKLVQVLAELAKKQ